MHKLVNKTFAFTPPSCLKQLWRSLQRWMIRQRIYSMAGSPDSKKLEDKWPLLPSSPASLTKSSLPASSIPPAQKVPEIPVSRSVQTQKKSPEDYAKYAQYFKGNKILPIKLGLKIDLVSYPARAEGLVNMIWLQS